MGKSVRASKEKAKRALRREWCEPFEQQRLDAITSKLTEVISQQSTTIGKFDLKKQISFVKTPSTQLRAFTYEGCTLSFDFVHIEQLESEL